jgi:hypothetical protein
MQEIMIFILMKNRENMKLPVDDKVPLQVSQAMVVEEALQEEKNILEELARILCSRPHCRFSSAEQSSMAQLKCRANPSFAE